MINILRILKHKLDYIMIRKLKVVISKNSYIKKPYTINNGKYIIIGNNVSIGSNATLSCFDHYSSIKFIPNIIIENNVFINSYFYALSAGNLKIGHDTYIGPNVMITNENHGVNPEKINYGLQELSISDVFIENNCWIGASCVILPGVTIGRYSIIGAGSVVTKSIPEYSIAVGNPAKVIKKWNFDLKKWIFI